jgi:predicted nucleic acid-binding protein
MDAGPLVALLDEDETDHRWAVDQASRLPQRVLTCDAVLTEAFHLVSRNRVPGQQLRHLLRNGKIVSDFASHQFLPRILELMEKYRDVPMSFADACLVCMVENRPGSTLFTLDHDFTIYRQQRRRIIPLLAPF